MTDDTDDDSGTEHDWFDAGETVAEPEQRAASPPFDTAAASWFDDVAMDPPQELDPAEADGQADDREPSPDVEMATNGRVETDSADGAVAGEDAGADSSAGDTGGAARRAVVDGAMKHEEADTSEPDRAPQGGGRTPSAGEPAGAATADTTGEASAEPADRGTADGEFTRGTANGDATSSAGERSPEGPTAGSTAGREQTGPGGPRPADDRTSEGASGSPRREDARDGSEEKGLLASIVAAIRSLFGGS